jgi:hypothetical protein
LANKLRKCKHCKERKPIETGFIIGLSFLCGEECRVNEALTHLERSRKTAQRKADKSHKEKTKALRRQSRAFKEANKTKSDWNKEAQAAFNKYIRARDYGKPCIACGAMSQQKYGGTVDASHFRSRGSSPNLRFHLLNCWSGCTRCNRYLSGNITEYRKGLIDRIGLARVEELECDNRIVRMDIEYLKRVKSIFNKRARLYEKLRKEKL